MTGGGQQRPCDAVRIAKREEGLAFARRWKAERRAVAYTGPYPIRDHGTCAEWE